MRRIPELDGLRGLAALAVVGFHLSPSHLPYGWAAVDLFFVLSGFLITSIVIDQMDEPRFLRNFYFRRNLRIWPIYYLTLLTLVILEAPPLREWLPFGLYVQNMGFYFESPASSAGQIFSPNWSDMEHTWSLAVEEQFYLIWPGLVLLTGRRGIRALALACLAGSILARVAGYPFSLLITRCDGLALGALLATLQHRGERRSSARGWTFEVRWLLVAAGALVALLVVLASGWWTGRFQSPLSYRLESPPLEVLTVSLLSFLAVAMTVHFSGRGTLAPLRWSPLRGLGTISYGVYLYHYPVIHAVFAALPRSTPAYRVTGAVLSLLATFGLAVVSWHFVERQFLKLKHRFEYRPAPVSTGPGPEVVPIEGVPRVVPL